MMLLITHDMKIPHAKTQNKTKNKTIKNQWASHFVLIVSQTNLPDYYRVWLDLANNLTHLIETRKLRDLVHKVRNERRIPHANTDRNHGWQPMRVNVNI